ncbi:MAG: hypothetical protein ACFBQW_06570 [Sphingomonadaceae bacterium]
MSPPPVGEDTWRARFIIINLVRIGFTLVAILGLAIWYSDIFLEGGSMAVGLPLALLGVLLSFLAPRWLALRWREPPDR